MSLVSLVSSPFRNTFKYLVRAWYHCVSLTAQQRSAHERPIIFYSILIGAMGPVSVIAVPRLRASYGWEPAEKIPISYPLPKRAREPVEGYDDE